MRWRLPLSASDMRAIADALDPIEMDPRIVESSIIGRIEVIRPDGDPDDVCGYFVREGAADSSGEAWFGFVMEGESR